MRKTALIFFITALLSFAPRAWSIDNSVGPVRLTAGYGYIWADHDAASDYLLDAAFKLNKYHLLSIGGERLARTYVGGLVATDNRFAIGDTYQVNDRLYWENNASTAGAQPYFLPVLQLQTIPHYIFHNGNEASLAFKFSRYPSDNVETVSPGYLFAVNDHFIIGGTFNAIHTTHMLGSGFVYVQDKFIPRNTIRLSLAAGQSVEGPNLEGHFYSFSINYKYRISRRWWIEPYAEVYRGNIRDQNTVGTYLEWCPL